MRWPSVSVFVGLLALLLAFGCGSSAPADGSPVVDNDVDYEATLAKARDLSAAHMVAFAQGQDLSEDALRDLAEARRQFEGLISYAPTQFAPHIGAGRIGYALGDYESAKRSLEQGLALIPTDHAPQVDALIADVNNDLANIYFLQGDYAKAEVLVRRALKTSPEHPNYLATLASIALQAGDPEGAGRLVASGLKTDPENIRLKRLKLMIDKTPKQGE
ncbi:MAG TPA: tetratricopeptide repeat protein [Fimbriimonadaceae bacterium]|nr:tetratricopeptide repeat protein [Fimbriimonadaceae bacterium]HRJ97296.1 tetratricopeptide repeat protein [Fimbriimonadaceae bacterium]